MIPLYHIDAFITEGPFTGNPAAVCLLESDRDLGWMQRVAAEMNLSETAFARTSGAAIDLRWFTPTMEVDLCGHATLAAAHALWEHHIADEGRKIVFHTRSGELTASKNGSWIELDFPSRKAIACSPPPRLMEALHVEPEYVGTNGRDFLVVVGSEETIRTLAPDMSLLRTLGASGVIVTSRGSGEFDFISRFFAPGEGIDEDPVTGSAHCCLGPYWQDVLGTDTFTAYQASSRGGIIRIQVKGERILLRGQAVTVFSGLLT